MIFMKTYEQAIKRQIDIWFENFWSATAYVASITLINDFVQTKRIDFVTECRLREYVENEKIKIFEQGVCYYG